MKKKYILPAVKTVDTLLIANLLGLSAPGEGISDGGGGSNDDDPDSKKRGGAWQSMW